MPYVKKKSRQKMTIFLPVTNFLADFFLLTKFYADEYSYRHFLPTGTFSVF